MIQPESFRRATLVPTVDSAQYKASLSPLRPADIVGCRHRAVLRRAGVADKTGRWKLSSDWAQETEHVGNRLANSVRKHVILAQLPKEPRKGDRLVPSRIDISAGATAVEDTLEAIASGVRLIVGAHLETAEFAVRVDLLVRRDTGYGTDESLSYAPVMISGHSVARRVRATQQANCAAVDLPGLSLSPGVAVPFRHRAVAVESHTLSMAWLILSQWGVAARDVGLVGRASGQEQRCYFFPGSALLPGLGVALSENVPTRPRRVKECAKCEFHNHCRAQLVERQDVSLLLPGDRAEQLRQQGIATLGELAKAGRGELSALATAWQRGDVALRRSLRSWVADPELWGGHPFVLPTDGKLPMTDALAETVEIDVDMEAHPHRGTFLWGTFDGTAYRAFSDFSAPGNGGDAGLHVAQFWAWLMQRRRESERDGHSFRVWVYSAQGENYWLRHYARLHGGQVYEPREGVSPDTERLVMPTLEEVEAFINSAQWCDLFRIVKAALAGTGSLGLKTVAPLAGFHFSQDGVDGRAAIDLYEHAIGPDRQAASQARRTLERYNADDCVATSRVRAWLRAGAPGIPALEVASGK